MIPKQHMYGLVEVQSPFIVLATFKNMLRGQVH